MTSDLADAMRQFAATTASRAPLYSRLAAGFAQAPEVLAILGAAPARHRVPVTLFAAIHDLVLGRPDSALADWFPNLRSEPRRDDPLPVAVAFCSQHRAALVERVRRRPPQTNEVGRSALLVLGLAVIGAERGGLAHLDVGASAGLNLHTDAYGYDYSGHRIGGERVVISCEVRSAGSRLPSGLPRITSRLGLDRLPVDLGDPAQVRWLEACVWPDQADRFDRLRRAIRIAQADPVRILAGDAVSDLAAAIDALGPGHPSVTTSWVLTYLEPQRRIEFVHALDEVGRTRDLSWVVAESPAYTPGLPWPDSVKDTELTVLALVTWRSGRRGVALLARAHPHGYWLEWC